mmetsp:Transcript_39330/g.79433  ORF Transcript_39330/g.79433 Transcript_39330/m.79433 type:complete len:204 (+) Transcript_39330:2-613(+)
MTPESHQRQYLLHCGRHAVNNLTGPPSWATTELMSRIADELKNHQEREAGLRLYINPYRHWAGAWVGMWDINVMIEALKQRGLRVTHHIIYNPNLPNKINEDLFDLRADIISLGSRGFILNETPGSWLLELLSGNHWYALRFNTDGLWINCDSRLQHPELIPGSPQSSGISAPDTPGTLDALMRFLRGRAVESGAQLFHFRDE